MNLEVRIVGKKEEEGPKTRKKATGIPMRLHSRYGYLSYLLAL